MGRNGVGKTTVVNTLLGMTRLSLGRIELRGRTRTELRGYTAAQHGVAVVLQGRGILPNLTVEENLLLGAATRRRGPWNLPRIQALFPILRERRQQPGLALSGGQQQMLAIGRALMANPDLLILDEPSEGLAPVIVDEIGQRYYCDSAHDGMGIFLIEQNVSLIHRAVERFCVLSKGAIAETGTLQNVSREVLQRYIAI